MKRFSCYTLIELLTVIFVIAVLAGLIMPATALVRSRAKRINCSSNLKQVGMLAMQFSNDRNGQILGFNVGSDYAHNTRSKKIEKPSRSDNMVYGSSIAHNSAVNTLWTTGLVRYAKYDMEVFYCPADEVKGRNLHLFSGKDNNASYGLVYGEKDSRNSEDFYRPGSSDGGKPMNMSAVTRPPSGVFFIGESAKGTLGLKMEGNASDETKRKNIMNDLYKLDGYDPHSNNYNMLFLDGRVESLHRANISDWLSQHANDINASKN